MKSYKGLTAGAILLTSGMLAAPAAMAEVTGNIGIASQYIFRGVNFGDPQVSGGIDWSEGSFYAGTWISSAGGEQEVDFYGGFATDLFDIGYLYYYFPETAVGTADAAELYAAVGSGPFSAKVSYAPDGFSGTDDDEYFYVEAAVDVAVSEKASLSFHIGATELTGDAYDGATDTTLMDYSITLSSGDLYVMVSAIDYDVAIVNPQEKNDPTFTVGYSWSFDDIL